MAMKRAWKPGEEPLRGDVFISAANVAKNPITRSVRVEVNVVLHTDDLAGGGLPVMSMVELNQFDADPLHLTIEDMLFTDVAFVVNAVQTHLEVILRAKQPGWVILRGVRPTDPSVPNSNPELIHREKKLLEEE